VTDTPSQNPDPTGKLVVYIFGGIVTVAVLALGIFLLLDLVADNNDDTPTIEISGSATVGNIVDPPQPLTDFTFTANNGNPMSLSDLAGDYVLLAFGYTHCPDVCPNTLLNFRQVKRDLGLESDKVSFLFISVDGERDTPEVLDRYLERYDPEFIGMSGEDEILRTIQEEYGLFYEIRENVNSAAGYLVEHTASRFLIDPQGRLIRIYSFTDNAEDIAADIQSML
jgi:protein SCO1/2